MTNTNKISKISPIAALSRRHALGILGAMGAGVGLATACGGSDVSSGAGAGAGGSGSGLPACIVTPDAVEGPFFVDEQLNRSDLVSGEKGLGITSGHPLTLNIFLMGVTGQTCQPLSGAVVDIWHANVDGLYSDEPSNFVQSTDTKGQTYLRAFQTTGDAGLVTFKTIYPGWYATRTIHIHVKVRLYSASGDKTLEANAQLYFDDSMNDSVLSLPAYASRGPRSIPTNTHDQVFNGTGPGRDIDNVGLPSGQVPPGAASVAMVSAFKAGSASTASLHVGVKLS